MEKQIFLVRINPEHWSFKGEEKTWKDINKGSWIPIGPLFHSKVKEYDSIKKHKEHIHKIKEKDIVVGYTCNRKYIESLGRIVSGIFDCFDGKRFLVQKMIQLKNPISRKKIEYILENDPFLKVNQPTVTLIEPKHWNKIKEIILQENQEVKEDIRKLEEGDNNW